MLEKKPTQSKITKIEVQKSRKNRCSIYLDEEFAFGVHQELILKYGLFKGAILTGDDIEKILEVENRRAAKERAFRLIAYRDRSQKEIIDRLKKIGYDGMTIDWVVSELQRLKLIDDERFAVSFAKSKIASKPMGRYLMRQELLQKGLSDTKIEIALDIVYQEVDEYTMAMDLAIRQMKKYNTLERAKAKKRLCDFLMRRGFCWDIVKNITQQLNL